MLSEIRQLLRGVRQYSRGQRGAVTGIAAALLLESAFGVFVPMAFGRMIDAVIPHRDTRGLTLLLAILGVGAVAVATAGVFRDHLYARFQSGVVRDLRVAMFAQLQRLSLDYFARTHPGDILGRFSSDVATLDNALMAAPPWVLLPLFATVAWALNPERRWAQLGWLLQIAGTSALAVLPFVSAPLALSWNRHR